MMAHSKKASVNFVFYGAFPSPSYSELRKKALQILELFKMKYDD